MTLNNILARENAQFFLKQRLAVGDRSTACTRFLGARLTQLESTGIHKPLATPVLGRGLPTASCSARRSHLDQQCCTQIFLIEGDGEKEGVHNHTHCIIIGSASRQQASFPGLYLVF